MKQAIFSILLITSAISSPAESITRIACVGDSITFGAGVKDRAKNCYPAVLGRLLGKEYTVRNYGVNGATLLKKGDRTYWKLKAFKDATAFGPNIVIIKLGTNDTKPQNWNTAGTDFEADLRTLIAHFQKQPSKPAIYLCLPVPVHQDRWGINEKTVTEGVIPVIKKVAKEKNLPVIDLHKASPAIPKCSQTKSTPTPPAQS
jgi:lysophospholipase L1-like esterase